jgi:hypothetical protein
LMRRTTWLKLSVIYTVWKSLEYKYVQFHNSTQYELKRYFYWEVSGCTREKAFIGKQYNTLFITISWILITYNI